MLERKWYETNKKFYNKLENQGKDSFANQIWSAKSYRVLTNKSWVSYQKKWGLENSPIESQKESWLIASYSCQWR